MSAPTRPALERGIGPLQATAVVAPADGLIWAELGAARPGAGGTYLHLREAFQYRTGRLMPFLFVWSAVLVVLATVLATTTVVAAFSHFGAVRAFAFTPGAFTWAGEGTFWGGLGAGLIIAIYDYLGYNTRLDPAGAAEDRHLGRLQRARTGVGHSRGEGRHRGRGPSTRSDGDGKGTTVTATDTSKTPGAAFFPRAVRAGRPGRAVVRAAAARWRGEAGQ